MGSSPAPSAPPVPAPAPGKGTVPTPIEPGTQEVDANVDVVYVLASQ